MPQLQNNKTRQQTITTFDFDDDEKLLRLQIENMKLNIRFQKIGHWMNGIMH